MSPVILLLVLNTNPIGKAYMSVRVSSGISDGIVGRKTWGLASHTVLFVARFRCTRSKNFLEALITMVVSLETQSNPCFQPINFLFSPEIPTFFPPLLFHQTPKPPSANTFVTPFFMPPPQPPLRFSPSTPSLPAMPDTDSFSDSRKR